MIIPLVEHTKYLGVYIDSFTCDNKDIERHIKGIYSRGNLMTSRFKKCTDDDKKCLFHAYIDTTYACGLWTNFSQTTFKKASVAYNNICRNFFKLARDCSMSNFYVSNGMKSFIVLFRKRLGSFKNAFLTVIIY